MKKTAIIALVAIAVLQVTFGDLIANSVSAKADEVMKGGTSIVYTHAR
jgi:hypothetical protein